LESLKEMIPGCLSSRDPMLIAYCKARQWRFTRHLLTPVSSVDVNVAFVVLIFANMNNAKFNLKNSITL